MEIKQSLVMHVEKDGKAFEFHMPAGASIGAAYDAAYACLDKLLEMSREAAEKAKPVKDEEKKAEESAA